MHRVALAVVRAGVRVLPPPEHLHVVDNSVADGRKRRDRRGVDALPEVVPVLVDALGRVANIRRLRGRGVARQVKIFLESVVVRVVLVVVRDQ